MLSLNHTSTPTIRVSLLRDLSQSQTKILFITDMAEDIFVLQKFAYELSGNHWTYVDALSGLWDALGQESGYFFLHVDLLRSEGNLTHLERSSGMTIERGADISEARLIEELIHIGYTHGDASDTSATYRKEGGTITIRDAILPQTIQLEWFDTELDSIICHRDDKRAHIANIRISAKDEEKIKKGEQLNPELLDLLRKNTTPSLEREITTNQSCTIPNSKPAHQFTSSPANQPTNQQTIIVSGCDFLEDKTELLRLADIHMGAFAERDGVSVEGSVPEIASIIEFAELLRDTSLRIDIYTKYPRTIEDFLTENSITRTHISLHEIGSSRLTSAMWLDQSSSQLPKNPTLQKSHSPIPQHHLLIADDILGQIFVKKRRKKSIAKHLDLLLTLKPGDHVVHREHGIGLFHVVVKKTINHIEREYLELHYAEGDKLFVPLTEIYRVSKYIGENSPELTRLSGTEWERTLAKTDEEIAAIAEDILETSARRSLAKGRSFGSFPDEEKKFQDAFAYEYTADQRSAIEDIFHDMESSSPMDRLISGDVGFGKTEVAMNAIYKAVLSGTQVAVLSPLLVLADEHYETFTDRLGVFGVRVGILTRMSTPQEVKNTLQSMRDGTVDVVVGTHRLISDDVVWYKLGLLVIDEEHKFGVTHKEKIKKLKSGLDILALSATPIPRSLNLALSGLKQISILATPPRKKKPIETIVSRWNEGVIKNAIEHELHRGGQVIILHNRIRGMESLAQELTTILKRNSRTSLPRGEDVEQQGDSELTNSPANQQTLQHSNPPSIIITHGQMPAEQIEDRIHAFKKREYDILLTTTIIENGVNFLSANTILIVDPEEFGLASLHQLRGRVGRKDVEGYAYLLYRKPELAREEKERLITIANNTHLGAGFEIAMRDMEIRGAGDVLGVKQAGKSKDVGLTLYFRLLEEKVEELKHARKARVWTKIELELSVSIPEEYFHSEADRLGFYRELENIETIEEIEEMEDEFLNQEKTVPASVSHLFLLMRIRLLLSDYGVMRVSRVGMNYVFDFREDMDVAGVKRFLERFDRKKQYILLSVKKIRVETRYWKSTEEFLGNLL